MKNNKSATPSQAASSNKTQPKSAGKPTATAAKPNTATQKKK